MNEMKCTVIQDLLPLYVDEVVSDDTKSLVDAHLLTCERCKQDYEQMKGTLYVPIETETTLFSNFKKRWNRKKWLLILVSILMTTLIGFAIFWFIFGYTKPIPYTADLFEMEEMPDGTLVLNYFGESHAGTHGTHPIEVEIDGEVKNISLVYYDETIAHSPTSNFLREDKRIGPDRLEIVESETVDAVYYGEFDLADALGKELTWEEILQPMTLIWERAGQ